MLKLKILAPALLLSASMLSPVSAAPVPSGASAESPVINVQFRDRDGDRDSRRHDGRRDRDYRRHRRPPHGWRRYHRRPYDWRTRGCILFGPLWFCP
jgi:hypothetical protein